MRGRPREFDRDQALDKAMRLFWVQGYEATGIAQLTAEMGIGRQSLYSAFGDKRSLFLEALDRYARHQLQPLLDRLEAEGSPLENLRQVLRAWQEAGACGDHSGCMMTSSACELGGRDTELSLLLERRLARMEEAFFRCLQRAQGAGELGADRDARALARFLTNTGQGLAVAAKIQTDPTFAADVVRTAWQLLDGSTTEH